MNYEYTVTINATFRDVKAATTYVTTHLQSNIDNALAEPGISIYLHADPVEVAERFSGLGEN